MALSDITRDGVLRAMAEYDDLGADEFLARFPLVEFVDVRGAGHMVAGDRNDVFADAVLDFLTRHASL